MRMHYLQRHNNGCWACCSASPTVRSRPLDQARKKRNLAEYDGDLDVTAGSVGELIGVVSELVTGAQSLGSA